MKRDASYGAERFAGASALLPYSLRILARTLPADKQSQAEEIRLRVGRPMSVTLPEGELIFGSGEGEVTRQDLETVLEIASQASAHTVLERVKSGFVTVRGGHRLGICGSGVVKEGVLCNLREVSSLNIRIAKEVPGIGERVLARLMENGRLNNTLILSPPGGGKTTLLRDLIRCISDGVLFPPLRVGVADERGELAAMENGYPQLELGRQTDIMDHCPKDKALLILLRGMNPQVLAVDEITDPADSRALELAVGCGVSVLATAHGAGLEDLRAREVYRSLLRRKVFRRIITIEGSGTGRRYRVVETEGGEPLCCV